VTTFVLQLVVGTVAGFVLFAAIYYVVPNRKQDIRTVWPGALLAGAAFELLTLVFPIYVHYFGSSNQYGKTFGFLFLVLSLSYFVGLITMVGVELNSLIYPVPVDQPEGAAALRSQPGGAASQRAPAATQPVDPGYGRRLLLPAPKKTSWPKALVGMAVVGLATLRHRRRRIA
jgi:membrane protein